MPHRPLRRSPKNSSSMISTLGRYKIIGEIVQGLAFLLPADFRLFDLPALSSAVEWAAQRGTPEATA